MQRLYNLDKWSEIPAGKAFFFNIDRPRVFRAEVNSAGPVNLYMIAKAREGQEPQFVARIDGRDTIECVVPGAFGLVVDGGPLWLYTIDGDAWVHQEIAPEVFTRIHERRQRNPELEYMMAKMQANMEKRIAHHARELAEAVGRRDHADQARLPLTEPGQPAGSGAESSGSAPPGAADKPARGRAKDAGRRDDEE